jgi:4-amino-4-deoxy-L-arabinose transferase-like glycosyltransferase
MGVLRRDPRTLALAGLSRLSNPRVAVPVLLIFALALRLPNLLQSLWLDEAIKATHQRFSSLPGLWRFVSTDLAAPLHPSLLFFWVELVGESELAVRLPSLAFGLASIWLVYTMARRFDASPLLASLILALSPAFVWYSRDATHYTMYAFLVLLAAAVWPRVSSEPFSWRAHLVYVLALLAASFTHYYAAVYLAPFTLLALRAPKPIRNTILLSHVVVAASLVVWLIAQYERGGVVSGQGHLRPFTAREWWMLHFHWFAHGNTLWTMNVSRIGWSDWLGRPGMAMLQLALLALLARGLWPGGTRHSRWTVLEIGSHLSVLPLVLFGLTLAGFDRMYTERYLLVSLPFFAIVVARGATSFSRPRLRTAAVAGLVALGVISYVAVQRETLRRTVYSQNPDWQSSATLLADRFALDPRMVVLHVVPHDDFAYHLRREMGRRRPPVLWENARHSERLLARGETAQIVIVRNGTWPSRSDEVIARFRKDPRVRLAHHDRFKLVDLYTFVPTVTREPRGPGGETPGAIVTRDPPSP